MKHYVSTVWEDGIEYGITCTCTEQDATLLDGAKAVRWDGELSNVIPEWVASIPGLIYVWCFFQDSLNFKNPFK
jgi:hypothetical protein